MISIVRLCIAVFAVSVAGCIYIFAADPAAQQMYRCSIPLTIKIFDFAIKPPFFIADIFGQIPYYSL